MTAWENVLDSIAILADNVPDSRHERIYSLVDALAYELDDGDHKEDTPRQ